MKRKAEKMKRRLRRKKAGIECGLREIRHAQDMTMMELSKKSGVPLFKIGYIERRMGEGDTSVHLKLAKALGVSLDEYFGLHPEEPLIHKEPVRVESRSGLIVEELPYGSSSERRKVMRIKLSPKKTLLPILCLKTPTLIYIPEGKASLLVEGKPHILKRGEFLGLSQANQLQITNVEKRPLHALVIES